jgi:hypothetical protein
MRWKTAHASVTGTAHSSRGEAGQDACRAVTVQFADTDWFIGIVADGAGSTTDGGRGAEIACQLIADRITGSLRAALDLSKITDDDVRAWVTAARDAVAREAATRSKNLREYASTVIGVVAGGGRAIFFQLGDGAIVTGPGPAYRTVFWPEQGEYANTTFFLTDETYLQNLKILHDDEPDGIALFTDGLQSLALSFAKKEAHAGFFAPLFLAAQKEPADGIVTFPQALAAFLRRDDISARSDDDKTLVLAVRTGR